MAYSGLRPVGELRSNLELIDERIELIIDGDRPEVYSRGLWEYITTETREERNAREIRELEIEVYDLEENKNRLREECIESLSAINLRMYQEAATDEDRDRWLRGGCPDLFTNLEELNTEQITRTRLIIMKEGNVFDDEATWVDTLTTLGLNARDVARNIASTVAEKGIEIAHTTGEAASSAAVAVGRGAVAVGRGAVAVGHGARTTSIMLGRAFAELSLEDQLLILGAAGQLNSRTRRVGTMALRASEHIRKHRRREGYIKVKVLKFDK